MNKKIQNPLIVNFYQPDDNTNICAVKGSRLYVPEKANWGDFTGKLDEMMAAGHDSILIQVDKSVDLDKPGTVNSINIKMNQLIKVADNKIPVLTTGGKANEEAWYLMNPSYEDQRNAHGYAPSDETVMTKYASFEDNDAWQKHQSQIWARMTDMMPLSTTDKFGTPNHLAQLTSEARGLEKADVGRFFSYKSNKMLSPILMGDDMIGMPGIDGKDYEGFTIVTKNTEGKIVERPQPIRSLKTIGKSGFAIPMANLNGDIPKYQIATDPSKINVELKAKAADGISFQKSEYYNKKTGVYTFTFEDGTPSDLKVSNVSATTGDVTFSDEKGSFTVHMKEDILSTLKERGYEMHSGIDTLKVVPSSKYIWPSKGTMVGGSEEVSKMVSPSNPGFIVAREPKNESAQYTVVVAEGALKGHIVAKYIDVEDKNGKIFGDEITGNNGIIVAQVPGVARAFVEGVKPVYDKYPVETTIIAMDADGRDNKNVAKGIQSAYDCLSEATDHVEVMSWNPDQKGLDDALLAVSRKEITLEDMGIAFGTPEQLFPIDQAMDKIPYKFDGTRAARPEWQTEYTEQRIQKEQQIKQMQKETEARQNEPASEVKDNLNSLDDAVQEITQQSESLATVLKSIADNYSDEELNRPMDRTEALTQLQEVIANNGEKVVKAEKKESLATVLQDLTGRYSEEELNKPTTRKEALTQLQNGIQGMLLDDNIMGIESDDELKK